MERHSIVLLVNGVTDSIFIAKEDLVNVVNPHVPSSFLYEGKTLSFWYFKVQTEVIPKKAKQ